VRHTRRALRSFLLGPLFGCVALVVLAPGTAAQADPTVDSIDRKIKAESARLERVVEQYNKTTEELKANVAAAQELTGTVTSLAGELDAASDRLGTLAAFAYKGGAFAEMSAVIASESPAIVVDRLSALDQITRFEQAEIARVTDLRTRHDARVRELNDLIADERAKRASLAEQRKKINADLDKLYALRKQAYGRAQAQSSRSKTAPPYVAGRAGKAVNYAYGALGKPYAWGADGPGGYDCSGLTMAAWRAAGVSLPHNAAMQWNALPHIGRASLRAGDLVFYSGLGHVGIYIGGNRIIHAPTFGEVVHISPINIMTPYGYARPG